MNRIYRTVWNEITRSFVAVAETVKNHGKRASGKNCTASAEHSIGAAPARRGLVTGRPNLMRLEPRLVFDGAAVDTVVAVDTHTQEQQAPAAEKAAVETKPMVAQPVTTTDTREAVGALEGTAPYTALLLTAGDPTQRNGRVEIVFVEDSITDWQGLVNDTPTGIEIVKLDHRGDGLKQMADYLVNRDDVNAIHILSHGSDGQVNLGALTLNSGNLDTQANTLVQIGQALTAEGDILLYGCEVSQSGNGQAFIREIARLTQADIAASSDLTGDARQGGDWQLEVATGTVGKGLSFEKWGYVLDVTPPGDGVYSFADAVDNADGTYTTADGFFLIRGNSSQVAGTDDDSVYADEGGASVLGDSSAAQSAFTSYIEVTPVATGSFTLNSASLGEFYSGGAAGQGAITNFQNIHVVGLANGIKVAETNKVNSPPNSYDTTYSGFDFSSFAGKQIDTVRVYFDASIGDMQDRLTLYSLDISGASTTPAPEVPVVHFSYNASGTNFVNGVAQEGDLGNTIAVDNAEIYFGAGVNDGAYTKVSEIGGSSGVSNLNGQLEYFSLCTYDNKPFFLRQFKVYNDSASDITLTITGHTSFEVFDSGLATNSAQKTTTATAKAGTWTTIDVPGDFGKYAGYRLDSGAGDSTSPLYFNDFAIDAPPPTFDLNGVEAGNDFSVTSTGSPVVLADTDADISGINDIIFYLDLSQIKTGDKLVFGDPASDGVEVGLDNITNPSDPVSFDGTTIAAINDRTIDAMFGDGQYIVIQVSAQSANAITQLMETGMKFSGSVAGDRDFHFLNTGLQPLATATVTVEAGGGGGAIVLDLDQVGTGNADTNNSTAVYDWDIPAYIADSGSVLGNDAPAEYKKLTISFDTADWTEDWYAYLSVANEIVESTGDSSRSLNLNRDADYSRTFYTSDYGGGVDLKLTLGGDVGGPRTVTVEKSGGGNISKADLNIFLQNVFFEETESRFNETRVFSLKATAADDSETAVSTFSVTCAPDTTGPAFDYINYPENGATALPIDFFQNDRISFEFDEDVTPVAGKYLKLWKVAADGPDIEVESVEVTDEDAIEVSGTCVYYTPQVDSLANGARYYITIDAGAFVDGSTNPSSAYDGSSDWSFSTIAEPLGTWTIVDTNPSTPDVVDHMTTDSSSGYRGNLKVTANGKYVLMSESGDGSFKNSILANQGLSVKIQNPDGSWSLLGEERFASASPYGYYELVVDSQGATDTLYVVSASWNNWDNNPNAYRLHKFDGTNWVQVGANIADNIGATNTETRQPPKTVILGNNLMVAYQYSDNGTTKVAVKQIDLTSPTGGWSTVGTDFTVTNSGEAFELVVRDGIPILGIVGGGNSTTLQLHKFGQNGWESAAPPIDLLNDLGGFNYSWGNASTLKLAQDGNGLLYAAYGYNNAGADKTAISKIDLSASTPTWTHLANPVDSIKNQSFGNGLDLVFDSNNVPYLALVPDSGNVNVYRWESNDSWRELDTSNSLDNLTLPASDLEIDNGVLKLLMSSFGGIMLAQFEPNPNGGGDTTAPNAPGAALTADTGSDNSDKITKDGTLTLSGVEDDATVEYSSNGTDWSSSFTPTEGSNTIYVRQTDVAGNVSAASAAYTFTLDTAVPSAPTIALTTDSGSSDTDKTTNSGALTVNGKEDGATLEYSTNGTDWSSNFTPAEGSNTVYVRQTDAAGNVSAASTAYTFTLDTAVPSAPTIALTTDSGSSDTDKITNSGALTVSGVETGATVQYSTTGTSGWTSSFTPTEGNNTVYVRQTDAAGNVSAASTAYTFTLDTSAPGFSSATVSGSSVVLTYNEALDATNLPPASAFTIKVNGVAVALATDNPVVVNAAAKTVTLTLAKPMVFGKTMTVSYADPSNVNDVQAIQDTAGNDAAALVDQTVANNSAATTSVTVNSTVLPSRQVTIEVPNGLSVNDASSSASPSGLPKNVKLPLGQFGFEITGVAVGGTANLSMTLDADLKALSYFKYNYLTGKWDNIATGSSINTATGKATVNFSLTDGGAYDADRTANGVIVDPGGTGENSLLPYVLENTVEVGSVVLVNTDKVNGTIGYAITGGADQARFRIDANTGVLVFIDAPDFETPTDTGEGASNNTYVLQVTIRGSNGGSEVQNLVVTVLNVLEDGEQGGISTLATIAETTPVVIEARPEVPYVPPPTPAPPPVTVVAPPPPPTPASAPEAPPLPLPVALSQPVDAPVPVFVAPSTLPTAPVVSTARSTAESPIAPMSLPAPAFTAPESGTFRIAVAARAPGAGEALVVNTPLNDITVAEGSRVSVTIPAQAFAHTSADASVTLSAQRANGAALPGWMSFNPQTGTFEGTPPPGFKGEVVVRVIARDKAGREAVQVFKIAVGVGQGEVSGERGDRPGNAEQGQPRGSQIQGQRGTVDKLGKPSLAKQFDRHGPAARHAETNELILAARKAVQALSLSGRA